MTFKRKEVRKPLKRRWAAQKRQRQEQELPIEAVPTFRHIAWVGQTQQFFTPR